MSTTPCWRPSAPSPPSFEVSTRRAADWEKAILTGYRAWRRLRETDGGFLDFDMTAQTLEALASGAGGGPVEDDLP
ncbi:hypothetical protein [Actinomadura geliboluensis]|uniref:hypothetical protein n=1 Tax=Actinomadura geliboluensis TaxID=882440 RepID=UPI003B969695